MEGVPRIPPTASESQTLIKERDAKSMRSIGPYRPVVQARVTTFARFYRIVECCTYCLLSSRQKIWLQEAQSIHKTEKRIVGIFPQLRNFLENIRCNTGFLHQFQRYI